MLSLSLLLLQVSHSAAALSDTGEFVMFKAGRTHPKWNGHRINSFVSLALAFDLIALSRGEAPTYLTRRASDRQQWKFRDFLNTTRVDRMALLSPPPTPGKFDTSELFEKKIIDVCVRYALPSLSILSAN